MSRGYLDSNVPPRGGNGEGVEELAESSQALAAYDEQLRLGIECEATFHGGDPNTHVAAPADLVNCLHLIERIFPRASAPAEIPSRPSHIGRFLVERVLGHGGFGIVYLARDPVLDRQVAVKVPRLQSLADEKLRDRFRREARAAATLDHVNIVPIYEAGRDGPIYYIASAYCPGPNLAEWMKQQTVPVSARLAAALVCRLATAIHYSHTHGVLHRDLKPSNVMLVPTSESSTEDDGDGLPFLPRLTDFGLAKLLDSPCDETAASTVLGTPSYMAPEQFQYGAAQIGPPTDVYGLGVVLYEMISGRPPYLGEGVADVLDQARHSEPVSPRRLRREIPRDLETICLKCIEKVPRQRYATANDLADDLRRFLRGEAIHARPSGVSRTLFKWIRRRPLLAVLLVMIGLAALAIPISLMVHNWELRELTGKLEHSLANAHNLRTRADVLRQTAQQATAASETLRKEAENHRRAAAELAYASSIRLAELAWRDSDLRQCRSWLCAATQRSGFDNPPGIEWHFLDQRTSAVCRELGMPMGEFTCVDAAPDGKTLAVGNNQGAVQIIEVASGVTLRTISTSHGLVRGLAYNKSGNLLASCGNKGGISLWNPATAENLFTSRSAPSDLTSVTWARNDEWVAAIGGFPAVHLSKVSGEQESVNLETNAEKVTALTVSPDGRQLVAGGHNGTVWIWEASTCETLNSFTNGSFSKITCLAVSPDGCQLAIGNNDQRVRIYSCQDRKVIHDRDLCFRDDIRSLEFSPHNDCLAVLEQFGTLHVAHSSSPLMPTRKQAFHPREWQAHEERGTQLAFLPIATQLVSVGRGSKRPRLWDTHSSPTDLVLPAQPVEGASSLPLLFSPDSKRLITSERGIRLWSLEPLELSSARGNENDVSDCLAITTDGQWLATGNEKAETIAIWGLTTSASEAAKLIISPNPASLAFSPDGNLLAVASWQRDTVDVFDRSSGERVKSLVSRQCHEVAFSPDGYHLAVDDLDEIAIWSTNTWTSVARLKGHAATILSLNFSSHGQWLASAGRDREIRIWDAKEWRFLRGLNGHRADVIRLRFTSDSRSLVALDAGHFIKVWHPDTGQEMCNLRLPTAGFATQMAVSTDMHWLAVRSKEGQIEVCRLKD